MRLLPFLLCFALWFADFGALAANRPYPRNADYAFGVKPDGWTQAEMNADVQSAFEAWRATFLTQSGAGGHWRVRRAALNSYDTVSEGIGYGLLILVSMDNTVNQTQAQFDEVYRYSLNHLDPYGLMYWRIDSSGATIGADAATDAEEDIAMALIMADGQWGSAGAIDYLSEARTRLGNLMNYCVENGTNVLKPGDTWGGSSVTNPSYFAPAYYRIFQSISGDARWGDVIRTSTQTLRVFYDRYPTGLVPNWTRSDGGPASGWSYDYTYDACRVPWRIGLDYLWFGTSSGLMSKALPLKSVEWVQFASGGSPANIGDGYALSGTRSGLYNNAAFVGPWAVASMVDPGLSAWRNTLYSALRAYAPEEYYPDALRLLTLLVLSGNFPNDFQNLGVAGPDGPPVVDLIRPFAGTLLRGAVTLQASAADDVGIDRAEFWVDGSFRASVRTPPYAWTWETLNEMEGPHSIEVKAFDTLGQSFADAPVVVVVRWRSLPPGGVTSENPYRPRSGRMLSLSGLPQSGALKVRIYSLSGALVRSLEVEGFEVDSDGGTARWDGRNEEGRLAASGVYFYLASSGSETARGKIAVLK